MNPNKVSRNNLNSLTDLPNIGKAGEGDLIVLGINKPNDLVGLCPYQMHDQLCSITGIQHDVCVIDVFISVTRFIKGDEPMPWWKYTSERKENLRSK